MTATHLKNYLSGSAPVEKPVAQQTATTTPDTSTGNNAVQDKDKDASTMTTATEGKASDHMLATGSRKRSILLNMMLPPEPPAVDAKLALPPVILFPPVLEPEGTITIQDRSMDAGASAAEETAANSSNSTAWSLRSWAWGSNSEGAGKITKRTKGAHHTQGGGGGKQDKHGKKDGIVKTVSVVESKTTTTVSKTTQVRTWISKIGGGGGRTESDGKQVVVPHSTSSTTTTTTTGSNATALENTTVPGGM
ncbi:hypothetical protein BGX29_009880, partial [Mortierella sp. GBA35]